MNPALQKKAFFVWRLGSWVGSFGWEVVLFTMLEYCFPLFRNSEFMDHFAICVGWVLKQNISASMVDFFRVSPMLLW